MDSVLKTVKEHRIMSSDKRIARVMVMQRKCVILCNTPRISQTFENKRKTS